MKNLCALEKDKDHSNAKQVYRDTIYPCTLFPQKGVSSGIGSCCAMCCIRVNSILQEYRRPVSAMDSNGNLLPNDLIEQKVKEHRDTLAERLPDNLKKYYEIVPRVARKSWDEISGECKRCEVNSERGTYGWHSEIIPEGEPTKITVVRDEEPSVDDKPILKPVTSLPNIDED